MITEAQKEAQELFDRFNKEGLHQISSIINRTIRKQMIKQCAIISINETIKYAKTFGDVTELDIVHYEETKQEIEKL
jgi:hypothetical protein